MKKALLTLTLVLCFAFAVSAQVPTPLSFYAGGAVSLPNSPDGFSADWKMGWNGMAGVGYKFAPNMQVLGKLEYHNFSSDLPGGILEGGNTKFLMFGADARYSLGLPAAPVKPYFFGGFGLAHMTLDEFTGSDPLATSTANTFLPYSSDQLYWNIGVGFDLKTGPSWSLFAQGRYVNVATEGDAVAFIPFTVGFKFF